MIRFACILLATCLLTACHSDKKVEAHDEPSQVPANTPPTVSEDMGFLNTKLPDIKGTNHRDQPISLQNVRSKYVLLEFWASWCPPCRAANPELVSVYKKYHDRGLEIFSISLDDKHSKWVDAIEKDQLSWPYHICEYQGWESKYAAAYKIESIPNNLLYDSTGQILAKSLEPGALDRILGTMLPK